jgi:hypothetical protein
VAGSTMTVASAAVAASALTLFGAVIRGCVATLACLRCTGCVGCVACTDCVDCSGCVGCRGLRGAVGKVGERTVTPSRAR